jgi:hypothetical protein
VLEDIVARPARALVVASISLAVKVPDVPLLHV